MNTDIGTSSPIRTVTDVHMEISHEDVTNLSGTVISLDILSV